MYIPIRYKLILNITLPMLVIYLLTVYSEYQMSVHTAARRTRSYLVEATGHFTSELEGRLIGARYIAQRNALLLGDLITNNSFPDSAAIYKLLESGIHTNSDVYGAAFACEPTSTGKNYSPYVCRKHSDTEPLQNLDLAITYPKNYTSLEWYAKVKAIRIPHWSEPYYDEGGADIFMCTYSVPIIKNGVFYGVTTVDVTMNKLTDMIQDFSLDLKSSSSFFSLISHDGFLLTSPQKNVYKKKNIYQIAEEMNNDHLKEFAREIKKGENGEFIIKNYMNENWWGLYAPIREAHWMLCAFVPEDELYFSAREDMKRDMIVLLCALAVILTATVIAATAVTRPVTQLALAAEKVAQADLDVQVHTVTGDDEIGKLVSTFNMMVRELKEQINQRILEAAKRKVIERELNVAREIQVSLLPVICMPNDENAPFNISARNVPARFIAGDFYDFWLQDEHTLFFLIADVSGKGVPAAMFMAVTRTILRGVARTGLTPADVLKTANDLLQEFNDQMFVTIFLAQYNTLSGDLLYCNAGHCPPLIINNQGVIRSLNSETSPMVGILPELSFKNHSCQLKKGDILCLFTDGVTEASNPQKILYGYENLQNFLHEHYKTSLELMGEELIQEVDSYRCHESQDDITLLLLRRN